MHTLVDNFDSFNTANPPWQNSYGSPTLTSGRIHLSCVNTYEGIISGTSYDFTDSSLTCEMVSIPTGGGNSRNTMIEVRVDASNRIEFGYLGDGLYLRQIAAGVTTSWEGPITYNATNHRWWRITHTTGTGIRAYTSPDGKTWTLQGSAHTTSLTLTAMNAHIFCGYFGTETSPPDAQIDRVNNPPIDAPAGAVSVGVTANQPPFGSRPPAGTVAAAAVAHNAPPKVGAQSGKKQPLCGAYTGLGDDAGIVAHEALVGRKLEVVNDYMYNDGTWASFLNKHNIRGTQLDKWRRWRDERPGSKLAWGVALLVGASTGQFTQGINGDFDQYYTSAAEMLVESGHPDAIVRLGWEPNNPDIGPWQATDNPTGYAGLFAHAVTVFRSVSGQNFKFELSSACGLWTGHVLDDFEDYYPGNSYVDYIGMNVYDAKPGDPGATPQARWNWLKTKTMGLDAHVSFVASKGKTNVCSEWGLYSATGSPDLDGGGDNPYFVERMAEYFRDNNVYYQAYFNADFGGGTLDDFSNGLAQYKTQFQEFPTARVAVYRPSVVKSLSQVGVTATAYGVTVPGDRTVLPGANSISASPEEAMPRVGAQPRRIGF